MIPMFRWIPTLFMLLPYNSAARTGDSPLTRAERTEYRETSHYEDVIGYLTQLHADGAPISIQYIGTSQAGRKIPLVIASHPLFSSPAEARRSGKPIVYIQANIHGGEVEGKEAVLMLLRDAA